MLVNGENLSLKESVTITLYPDNYYVFFASMSLLNTHSTSQRKSLILSPFKAINLYFLFYKIVQFQLNRWNVWKRILTLSEGWRVDLWNLRVNSSELEYQEGLSQYLDKGFR